MRFSSKALTSTLSCPSRSVFSLVDCACQWLRLPGPQQWRCHPMPHPVSPAPPQHPRQDPSVSQGSGEKHKDRRGLLSLNPQNRLLSTIFTMLKEFCKSVVITQRLSHGGVELQLGFGSQLGSATDWRAVRR